MNDSIANPGAPIDYASEPQSGGFLTQTWALLMDAYRDLQSRKLFWVTLVLSFLIAGVFAFVGIDSAGLVIFGKHLRAGPFNTNIVSAADFYKIAFTSLAIPLWLGFLSTILALIAVGGIFPDTISSGSIDLYLSRPIGRLRLFLTKYTFGLLFTAAQVLLFSFVCFLIIGFRGGAWELGIFLAVPLVTLFFSYLYCICVLVGILTRSTLAAILVTALFWGFLYAIHSADFVLTGFSAAADERVAQQQRLIDSNNDLIKRNDQLPEDKRGNMSAFIFQRDKQIEAMAEYEQTAQELQTWRDRVWLVNAPLPKTSETVQLMSRYLVSPTVMERLEQQRRDNQQRQMQARSMTTRPGQQNQGQRGPRLDQFMGSREVQQRVEDELGARDLPWIAGTSLGFEAVILGLAAWVFCRRDF